MTLVAAIAVAPQLSQRMAETIQRLIHRGTMVVPERTAGNFRESLEGRAAAFARRGGVLLALLIFVLYLWAGAGMLLDVFIETAVATVVAYAVGRIVGRMVCYGFLGPFLHKVGGVIKVQTGHPDGAAGLKPLGDFYFFQAMLLAIPIAFVAIWTLLIPVWPYHDYSHWQGPYLTLLVTGLLLQIAAFILPTWTVHQDMVREKASQLAKADQLGKDILELRSKIAETGDAGQRATMREQLDLQTKEYQEIEALPTWPIDRGTRRRFAVNNLAMFIPVVVQVIGAAGPWQSIANALERFLSQP